MKHLSVIFCALLFAFIELQGQSVPQNITGQVSFISSKNTYVRFLTTKGISINDTLFMSSENVMIPALIVNSLSSTSCLCTSVSGEELPVGHIIIARLKPSEKDQSLKTADSLLKDTLKTSAAYESEIRVKTETFSGRQSPGTGRKQKVTGSISAASYSDFSNTEGDDIQRYRHTMSLNAANISASKISVRSYISFRHGNNNLREVRDNIFSALKIYSLEAQYDIDSSAHISLGRQINPGLSGIGSFDGLEFEKSIRKFTAGAIAGSRPGYRDYGFDPKLMQYGAYLSFDNYDKYYSGTSVAFMNQLNSGRTDRRFLYFQHSGSLSGKISLFSSLEADLFKQINDKPVSCFNLTSVYVSMNYRLTNKFNIGGSYDARKNPVYYETAKSLPDTLIENGLRNGYRLNASIRIAKSLMAGLQSSLRFLKTDLHQSRSLSGYLTYSLPASNYFSMALSGSYIETGFINSTDAGLSLSNSLSAGRIQISTGYRYQNYSLRESPQDIVQHTGRTDFSWQFTKKASLSLNYELTFEENRRFNRLYAQIRKRF